MWPYGVIKDNIERDFVTSCEEAGGFVSYIFGCCDDLIPGSVLLEGATEFFQSNYAELVAASLHHICKGLVEFVLAHVCVVEGGLGT